MRSSRLIPTKVAFVGGPDVDVRIDLMHQLKGDFEALALGTEPSLATRFAKAEIPYFTYSLARRVNPWSDIRAVIQMFWIFRHERPAVVHAFNTKPSVLGRLAARLAGTAVVVGTPAGFGTLYIKEDLLTRSVRRVYELLQKVASHLSDFTIFQNDYERDEFIRRGIAPADKSGVIPGSGVRTDRFSPAAVAQTELNRLRDELGLSPDTIVITLISRLLRGKGILEFAEAARIVRNRYPNVHFLLVGPEDVDGGDSLSPEEMKSLVMAVNWIGPRSDIPTILAVSDIFVLPSSYAEGIPRVLLEAASMGLPLVTTHSPGCVEVVEEGVNGFLIPLHDAQALAQAILKLVQNPQLRQQFGAASQQLVINRFDLRLIANSTRELYQRLLNEKGLI